MGGGSEAIVAHLHDGANVAEGRFLLRRLFARFVVHDSGDAGVAIVPEFRPDALEELLATVTATKRAALRLTTDANGLGMRGGVREPRAQRAHVCGNQPMATATGALVSSNSAGSNRASRRLYSLANAGQIVKFRPSAPTYHE